MEQQERKAAQAWEQREDKVLISAMKMKEEEQEEQDQRPKQGEEAADAAAARREMKDAEEPESCAKASWSQWDGKQDGWKEKQGWNKQSWGNSWEKR